MIRRLEVHDPIEEVEKYHRDTLILVLNQVNERIAECLAQSRREEDRRRQLADEHRREVEDVSKRINFEG
jgi:hypothetical protein